MNPKTALALCAALLMSPVVPAASPPDTAALLAAQRLAMQRLAAMDGQWRGSVRLLQRDGSELTLVQTERAGTLRLVEGAGHAADGGRPFQAFSVISFDPRSGTYQMRSHAQGHSGDFPLEVRSDGFSWLIPAGPATIRYSATIDNGTWSEVGERLVPGQPPQKILEMKLQRLGDSAWPAAGDVPPRTPEGEQRFTANRPSRGFDIGSTEANEHPEIDIGMRRAVKPSESNDPIAKCNPLGAPRLVTYSGGGALIIGGLWLRRV